MSTTAHELYIRCDGDAAIFECKLTVGHIDTVDGLQALVNNVTAAAASNIYGASPLPNPSTLNIGSIGPPISPVINVVQGDYTLSGSTTGPASSSLPVT